MVLSTQRIILMVVVVNLMIGIAMASFDDPVTEDTSQIDSTLGILENYEEETESQEGLWGGIIQTGTQLWENTIGKAIKWSFALFKILWYSLNPFSVRVGQFDFLAEQWMVRFLMFIRLGMMLTVGLEGWLVYKNRKAT